MNPVPTSGRGDEVSTELFRLIAENVMDLLLWSRDGVVKWVSPSVQEVLGWRDVDIIGTDASAIVHPDDVEELIAARSVVYSGARVRMRLRVLTVDGAVRWFDVRLAPFIDADGHNDGAITAARDITDQVAAERAFEESERALAEREDRYRLLAENASDLVYFADATGRALWVAPTVRACLGWTVEELVGSVVTDLVHPDDCDVLTAMLGAPDDQDLGGATASPVLARIRASDDSFRWMSVSARRVHELGNAGVSLVVGMRDVQELVATQLLAERGRRDDLTGLANRAYLLERLEQILGGNRRRTDVNALLYCDIDSFKSVNDSYGHAVGDQVLIELAGRLAHCVRDSDLVARIGGDEFVVVLRGLSDPADAELVAEKIRAALGAPVDTDEGAVVRTLSIGVAVAGVGMAPDRLLRNADAALYQAKLAGRDRVIRSEAR